MKKYICPMKNTFVLLFKFSINLYSVYQKLFFCKMRRFSNYHACCRKYNFHTECNWHEQKTSKVHFLSSLIANHDSPFLTLRVILHLAQYWVWWNIFSLLLSIRLIRELK